MNDQDYRLAEHVTDTLGGTTQRPCPSGRPGLAETHGAPGRRSVARQICSLAAATFRGDDRR